MSFAQQSWENTPGPTVGYQVAAHRARYAGDASNCRRQAQQRTSFCISPSFNIEMHSATEVSQKAKDSLAFISRAAAVCTDKSVLPLQTMSPIKRCSPSQPTTESERSQSAGYGFVKPETAGNVTVVKSKADMKSNLHVHFQIVPQELNKNNTRTVQRKIVNESPLASSLSPSPSSSSSIGQLSENSSCLTQKASEESEVQSALRSPLDQMSTLEDSLPIKRGLSRFYNGKSRSFTSLGDVSSVNDLAKPENPYAKKRKWLHGQRNNSRSRFGYPPINHSTSSCSKKSLSSRDSHSSSLISSESGSDDNTSKSFLAFADRKGWWKDCAPPRSYSLSDLEASERQIPACLEGFNSSPDH